MSQRNSSFRITTNRHQTRLAISPYWATQRAATTRNTTIHSGPAQTTPDGTRLDATSHVYTPLIGMNAYNPSHNLPEPDNPPLVPSTNREQHSTVMLVPPHSI